jgi:ATP-dependent helicase/nuclease subunit A
VSTLHGAKGLEWPITVLYEIDSSHKPSAFGVHIESDQERFDFEQPLAGRWIRFWPDPYAPPNAINYSGKTAVHDAVRAGAEHARVAQRETRETLRLLYVGWTRARDRLVLAARPGKLIGGTLALLVDGEGMPLIGEPAPGCTWAGRPVKPGIRATSPLVRERATPEPGSAAVAAGQREYPLAHADASRLTSTGTVAEVIEIGAPMSVQEPVEWAALGNACHAFLAADRPGLKTEERLGIARALLEQRATQGAVRPEDLVRAGDALRTWVERRWPGAAWHREWPVRLRREDGSEVSGFADLVLATADGFVLVDHKCLGGSREGALKATAGYAAQLGAYAEAIEKATGNKVGERFVHLLLQGVGARVDDPVPPMRCEG